MSSLSLGRPKADSYNLRMKNYLPLLVSLLLMNAALADAQKNLGPTFTDEGLSIRMKFVCGGPTDKPFKLRAFKYKLRVIENEKEFVSRGTQNAWLDINLTEIKLKFKKTRKITFKNVEISTDKWLRALPEGPLTAPIVLTLQECKDMGSY
jgi:hypothetical protein